MANEQNRATLLAQLKAAQMLGDAREEERLTTAIQQHDAEYSPRDIPLEELAPLPPKYTLAYLAQHFGKEMACMAVGEIAIVEDKDGNQAPRRVATVITSTGQRVRVHMGRAVMATAPAETFFWAAPALDTMLTPDRWPPHDVARFLANAERFGDGSKDAYLDPFLLWLQIRNLALEYIEFEGEYYAGLLATWVIGTYFHSLFSAYPYLHFLGRKASGKSKSLTFISRLAFNPRYVVSVTPAAVFRYVNTTRGTLLVDEAENLRQLTEQNQAILQILHSGYKQGGEVLRCEPQAKGFKMVSFQVYSPKALASIEELWGVLKDRVIVIDMQHSKGAQANRTLPDVEEWGEERAYCYTYALVDFLSVRALINTVELPPACQGRHRELWLPMFALAEYLDSEREDASPSSARADVQSAWDKYWAEYEENPLDEVEEAILRGCFQLLGAEHAKEVGCDAVVNAARAAADPQLFDIFTRACAGRIMKRLALCARKVRRSQGMVYLLTRERLQAACGRYGIAPESITGTPLPEPAMRLPYGDD